MQDHARYQLSQLDALEAESVFIFREVVAELERPCLLFSGGKDSIVMLHIARKAFAPARIPFPVMHVDTGLNFESILAYRDRWIEKLGLQLVIASVEDAIQRGLVREAFGKKLVQLGGNLQIIAQARCEIEAMRLMVLKAAKAMDVLGNKEARVWVSMVKAMVPERTCRIIDQAIQMHGATGISQWSPLSEMYTDVRHLRFADGPDEVHWMVVGRHELQQH